MLKYVRIPTPFNQGSISEFRHVDTAVLHAHCLETIAFWLPEEPPNRPFYSHKFCDIILCNTHQMEGLKHFGFLSDWLVDSQLGRTSGQMVHLR